MSTTETTNPAQEYAELIGREVAALDVILRGRPRGYYPDRPDYDEEDHADYRAALVELELDYLDDPEEAPHVWLNETALEVSVLVGGDRERVEILRTCGGPHCEITRDTNDGAAVEVHVTDGRDRYTHRMYPAAVADWLDTIAGSTI